MNQNNRMRQFWSRKWWMRVLIASLALVFVPYLLSRLTSSMRAMQVFSAAIDSAATEQPETLRIVCFNMAHGRGLASSNWEGGDHTTRRGRLAEISELLDEIDADIVVLNEVDFDASWSGHVNQAELLAMLSGYPYRVEQTNLNFRVLGWTWQFGNAVLSKYPITHAQLIDLPSYSAWEAALVGKKRATQCEVRVGEQTIRVVAAHLSHRSEALRVQSAEMIVKLATAGDKPTIVAGDLNSTPPEYPQSEADATGKNAMVVFDESELFRREPTSSPPSDGLLTFPAEQPIRVIDWVLIPRAWQFVDYRAVPTTLSDHRPVVAEISLSQQANEAPRK